MFTVAFLILGSDGVRTHHHVNENMFWVDFLAMIGAVGCCVSSALTIVVCPRLLKVGVVRVLIAFTGLLPQVPRHRIHG